jgi:hypothetical protein
MMLSKENPGVLYKRNSDQLATNSLALIDNQEGETKAQACAKAWFRQLADDPDC